MLWSDDLDEAVADHEVEWHWVKGHSGDRWNEVADQLASAAIPRAPLPIDDPKVRCPDITRARDILGWQPTVTLREGLVPTIEWFHSQLDGDHA